MSKPTPVAWGAWSDFEQRVIAVTAEDAKADSCDGQGDITIIPLYPSSALKALEAENARLREELLSAKEAHLSITRETNARATAAEARLKEALKVIEPFAKAAGRFDGLPVSKQLPQQCWFTPADLRAARRFMEESHG